METPNKFFNHSKFYDGQIMNEQEDEYLDFKQYSDLLGYNRQILKELVCAFINYQGGIICIGINDEERKVIGIPLNEEQIQQYKSKKYKESLVDKIEPKYEIDQIKIQIYPIYKDQNFNDLKIIEKNKKIEYYVIIQIAVQQGKPEEMYSIEDKKDIYFGQKIFLRINRAACQLVDHEKLHYEIFKRQKNPIKYQNIVIADEPKIDYIQKDDYKKDNNKKDNHKKNDHKKIDPNKDDQKKDDKNKEDSKKDIKTLKNKDNKN